MGGFIFVSILSILIVFIVPYIISITYMRKKKIVWYSQILWLLLITVTSYGGLVIYMLYNRDD